MEKYNILRTLSGVIIFISWLTLISVFITTGYLLTEEADIVFIFSLLIGGLITFILILSFGKLIQLMLDLRENQMNEQTDNIKSTDADSLVKELPKNDIEITDENDIEDEDLIKLNNLIKKDKKNILGSGKKSDIIVLLSEIITSKEKAFALIKKYNILYNENIIKELKGLSSSYNGQKSILSSFIEYGIVESAYPHDII